MALAKKNEGIFSVLRPTVGGLRFNEDVFGCSSTRREVECSSSGRSRHEKHGIEPAIKEATIADRCADGVCDDSAILFGQARADHKCRGDGVEASKFAHEENKDDAAAAWFGGGVGRVEGGGEGSKAFEEGDGVVDAACDDDAGKGKSDLAGP